MLLLTATTNILELATSGTSTIDVHASWVDMEAADTVPGSTETQITTATTTAIVAAPGASTQRQIKLLTVCNAGSAANTVTLKKDVSGTESQLFKATLYVGDSLVYTDGKGFSVHDLAGRVRTTSTDLAGFDGRTAPFFKAGTAPDTIGYNYCSLKDGGFPGAFAPGTPGINGRTTDGTTTTDNGCIVIKNPASGANYLTNLTVASTVVGLFCLIDVLWINSGIVVTTTTAQAITTPTFPARDVNGSTNGEGLMIGLLTTTANTNAAVINTSTVSYTNSDGTAGRTATLLNAVGAQIPVSPTIGTIVWFLLAAGDKGVRSIQSITLGTSLVAGGVSLLVARPLAYVPATIANVGNQLAPVAMNPGVRLYDGTCAVMCQLAASTTATTIAGSVTVMER